MRDTTAVVGAVLVVVAAFGAVVSPAAAATSAGPAAAVDAGVADSHCSYPMTVTDATGTDVTVEEEPERVVVLAPSGAQTMWAIGAEDKVVGMPVNQYTAYLNGTENKTNVVDEESQPVTEQVVGLEPDLVLAPNVVSNESVEALRDSGQTVYRFEKAESLSDVYEKIELYGRLVGNYEEAGRTSAEMQGQVAAIERAVAGEENPRVFFSLGGGWTAGENSFIGGLIEAAGGDNIAAGELNSSYGQLSPEVVAQKDPEWIVQNGQFGAVPKTEAFNGTTAVQEGNVVEVNRNYMTQVGPRNVRALKTMTQAFHPAAYENVNFSAVETPEPVTCESTTTSGETGTETMETATMGGETATMGDETATMDGDATMNEETETPAPETPDPGTATSTDGPGFTAVTALFAALVGGLFVRRRR